MRALELTEEHKSKLLEMCKALFPNLDYKCWGIKGPNELVEKLDILEYVRIDQFAVIHWFEFCMTHLALKLYDNTEETSELVVRHMTDYEHYISNSILVSELHPVDYLYEKFKTVNNDLQNSN